jgi:hypothetical protein
MLHPWSTTHVVLSCLLGLSNIFHTIAASALPLLPTPIPLFGVNHIPFCIVAYLFIGTLYLPTPSFKETIKPFKANTVI